MGVYIIAEAGVNHNGKIDLALKLCDAAKESNVDVIKFQTWKTEKIIIKSVAQANYQKINTGKSISQYEMLKKLEVSYSNFLKIKQHCDSIGIEFLSTADEQDSLDFLLSIGQKIIKLGSGDIDNIPYLRYVASKKIPVILSTGMSFLSDVDIAYRELVSGGCPNVTLLHCTTNYPCPMEEVNLNAMLTLQNSFKCKVGYSDHTMGIEVPIAAVALGAQVIEKHFTLDRNMIGPDHKASLIPVELSQMVQSIRNIEYAMGDGIKQPNQSEIDIAKVVLKRIVASKFIAKGEYITDNNITVKRANNGIRSTNWDLVCGTRAIKDYQIDDPIVLE